MIRFKVKENVDLSKYGFKNNRISRSWCRIKVNKDGYISLDAPTNNDLLVLMKMYADHIIDVVDVNKLKIKALENKIARLRHEKR